MLNTSFSKLAILTCFKGYFDISLTLMLEQHSLQRGTLLSTFSMTLLILISLLPKNNFSSFMMGYKMYNRANF